jgi:hypothetical protein
MKGNQMHTSPGPLDLITDIVQQIGLDVVYEHKDLVFVSRNAFILRCTEKARHIDLYFNEQLEEQKAQHLMSQIGEAGHRYGMQIFYKGAFNFEQDAQGYITLEFFDLAGQDH